MEFKEFSNPEGKDYDISSSLKDDSIPNLGNSEESNQYYMQLFDLIGLLEDIDEVEIVSNYGITMQEYLHPTAETIEKVSKKLRFKANDFSNCAKTPENQKKELEDLKEEIMYYNSCVKNGQEIEIEDDYEDCRKR